MSKDYQGLDIDWSPQRSAEALQGLHRKQATQGRLRMGIGTAAVLVVMSLGAYHSLDLGPKTRPAKVASAAAANSQELKNGSTIVAMSADAQFTLPHDTASSTQVRLLQGEVQVHRAPLGQRETKLTLLSDAYRIEVHAPSVWASHSSRETKLSIEQGFLEITGESVNKRLEAGQSIALAHAAPLPQPVQFVLEPPVAHGPIEAVTAPLKVVSIPAKKTKTAKAVHQWRDLANKGDLDRAYQELHKTGIQSVPNRVDDLMLAADIARGTGHARQALQPLSRILKSFASDSQAPLAAFTLGRIQLEDLKRPLAAARAFQKSYQLAPTGALAQDALAREVEALAKAGERERATQRARAYLLKYPQGHRVRSVKQHAGL